MKNKYLSLVEAKANLSACIREVENGTPMVITRHGKPVVALVRPEDLEHLERLRKAGPTVGLASLAGGWQDSEELADILDQSSRIGQRETAE